MIQIVTITGVLLILIGLWCMLTRKNVIRIIIGFSIVDTGIHILIVSLGYIKGKTSADFIAFKCDESRLVSELSTNSSEEGEQLKRRYFELNGKLLDFTIEAVDFRIKAYQKQMADKKTSEDDYADMGNDSKVLEVIKQYLDGG